MILFYHTMQKDKTTRRSGTLFLYGDEMTVRHLMFGQAVMKQDANHIFYFYTNLWWLYFNYHTLFFDAPQRKQNNITSLKSLRFRTLFAKKKKSDISFTSEKNISFQNFSI